MPAQIDCIYILDTNFIISHPSIVKELVHHGEEYAIIVLVPWVVIQELDGLKSSQKGYGEANLASLARNAINFIHESLKSGVKGLRGQKISESVDRSEIGDDAILDCGRFWRECQGRHVILLSNDKNLCSKIMIHEIQSISYEPGLSAKRILAQSKGQFVRPEETVEEEDVMTIDMAPVVTPEPIQAVEMDIDTVLPPIVPSKWEDNPFAELSAKAGPSIYERGKSVLPVRGSSQSPDRQRSPENSFQDVPANDTVSAVLQDIERTMLKALPKLIRKVMLREYDGNELFVNFVIGGDAQENATLTIEIIWNILKDNRFVCFGAVFDNHRNSAEVNARIRSMVQLLRRRGSLATALEAVKQYGRLWKTLSEIESLKYKAKQDDYIQGWQTQLRNTC